MKDMKDLDKVATLAELHHALGTLLMKRPDYKNRQVIVSTECGFSSAGISSPVDFYLTDNTEEIHILTNDDKLSNSFGGK